MRIEKWACFWRQYKKLICIVQQALNNLKNVVRVAGSFPPLFLKEGGFMEKQFTHLQNMMGKVR